jgi:pimeloyl-ACP methyl ester carboxylesterase
VTFLTAAGHRLEYRWSRPLGGARPDSPVLVFLHEGLGSVALWKDFPDKVSVLSGCPALVYSRYGYGRSDPLAEARSIDYMHREALDVLPEVLASLQIERPLLIGHSDGASIALIYAGSHAERLRGAIVMAPHVFVEDVTVASIAQAKRTYETTDLPTKLGRYHDNVESAFRGWNDIWLHPDFRAWNIEAYLSGITCPVLLIQGEDDRYGTVAQVDAIARQMKAPVQALVLRACGHSPHVDKPEETAQAIVEFVRRAQGLLSPSP